MVQGIDRGHLHLCAAPVTFARYRSSDALLHCVTSSPSSLLFLQMTEKLQDMENEAMSKIVELEKQLMQRNKDLESIRVSSVKQNDF